MTDDLTIAEQLQLALRNLTIATVVVYLVLIGFGILGWVEAANRRSDLAQVVRSTNSALCALRIDLEVRVASSEDFLVAHPEGIPGISRADIEQSISNQLRTITALASLECSGKP